MMESMHLKLIVDKKVKREIQILYLLVEQNQSISAHEFAVNLDVSLSTILHDLEILKEKIPKNWNLQLKKNIGYTLTIGPGVNFSSFIRNILETSPLFEIGVSIFNNELLNFEAWEDRLFIAESTLKRNLRTFKNVLKEYNLKLSMNPVNIIGNEINIRLFYFDLLYSSIKTSRIEGPTEKEFEFFSKLKEFVSFEYLQYFRTLYWFMIVVRRNVHGNEIKISRDLVALVEEKWDESIVEKIKELFFEIFSKHISTKEIVFLYLIRWDTLILNEKDPVVNIQVTTKKTQVELNSFLLKQISDLSIDVYTYPQAYIYFESFFNHMFTMSNISPLFQKNNDEMNYFIKTTHPNLYQSWLEALVENQEIFKNFQIIYFEDIAAQLTMLCFPYLRKDIKKPKHVMFIIDTTVINLNYLTALAKRYIMNNVRVSVLSNSSFSTGLVNRIAADLIVSNFEIETDQKITYISDLPTLEEWNLVNSLIFDMY